MTLLHKLISFIACINRDNSGFTLTEMLVVVAIMGTISGVTATTIMTINNVVRNSHNEMDAVSQVRNVGHWFQQDCRMAHTIETNGGDPSGLPVTLKWGTWDGTQCEVEYYLDNDELRRLHTRTAPSGGKEVYTTLIASSIMAGSPNTTCRIIDSGSKSGEVAFTVTATEGNGKYERSETRIFEVKPRCYLSDP